MSAHEVRRSLDLDEHLTNASQRLVVIDFHAHWCGPCRYIGPFFAQLASKYRDVVFLKVDVDQCIDIRTHYHVNAMPTFVFVRNGREIDRITGANPQTLEAKIIEHSRHRSESVVEPTQQEQAFLSKLIDFHEKMILYEDDIAQTLARSLIPPEVYELSAVKEVNNEFGLIQRLLNWFKHDFFNWIDAPNCEFCNTALDKANGTNGVPSEAEAKDGANRVEVYKCTACEAEVRFPRYNDPVKCGRCGEWANCFTLFCRSVGLETRLVYDVTDHLWNEVWIKDLDRWVHCDPCENVIDTPLLYEKGWGKKLRYVFAFGVDYVRDVTWRYSMNHTETIKRRTEMRESILRDFLKNLNARNERLMTAERKAEMEQRYMKELVEFISPDVQKRDGSAVEERGRTTGSLQWRKERGELGDGNRQSFVFVPSEDDIANKSFNLSYVCARDEYHKGSETIKGFKELTYECVNVSRVVDSTQDTAYFCLAEGQSHGQIHWSFNFGDFHVRRFSVRIDGMIRSDDSDEKVEALVCTPTICQKVPDTGELSLNDLDHSIIDFKLTFSGKVESNAERKAQLFRTAMTSNIPSFSVKILFG